MLNFINIVIRLDYPEETESFSWKFETSLDVWMYIEIVRYLIKIYYISQNLFIFKQIISYNI